MGPQVDCPARRPAAADGAWWARLEDLDQDFDFLNISFVPTTETERSACEPTTATTTTGRGPSSSLGTKL